MADEFDPTPIDDDPESPFIRITRSGSSTTIPARTPARRARATRTPEVEELPNRGEWDDDAFDADTEETEMLAREPRNSRARGSRPMPKRLSEERYEQEVKKRERKPKAEKAAATPKIEQVELDLKPRAKKPDGVVKQRQVLGFVCIVAAFLTLMMIVSYTPDDAAQAETSLSDLPAIFTRMDPMINAKADTVQNWVGLIGAMMADFLINKTIGYAAIIYPIFFGLWSLAFFRFTHKQRQRLTLATTFFLCTGILFSATIGTWQILDLPPHLAREWSGAIGQFLGITISRLIGSAGALIIYATLFVITLVFSIDLDIEKTFLRVKGWYVAMLTTSRRRLIEFWDKREAKRAERIRQREEAEAEAMALADLEAEGEVEASLEEPEVAIEEPVLEVSSKRRKRSEKIEPQVEEQPTTINEVPVEESGIKIRKATPAAIVASAVSAPLAAGSDELPTLETPRIETRAEIPSTPARIDPHQPLLKVRPAPKNPDGSPIPRMTRASGERLGDKTSKLAKLSNGAIDAATGASAAAMLGASATAAPLSQMPLASSEPESASETEVPEEVTNVDRQPLAELMEEPAITIRSLAKSPAVPPTDEAPAIRRGMTSVSLGDEKVVSNDVLPHSVSTEADEFRDIVREHQVLSRQAAKDADQGKLGIENPNLYKDEREGRKVLVPENPYNEILSKYKNPPLTILAPNEPEDELDADDEELAMKGRLLRDKLATFGVDIENIVVTPGPVVTLYEFTPAEGVKVSRVENLTDDIALAMKARGIRIIAPMPGRGTIGIEIPNDKPKMVRIRSLFDNPSFKQTKMNLPLALGKTISGDVYVDDLNKMPHLLIAGATGAGKSVGVNGIIASLLYSKSPRDVKFVIVDPKKIELSLYKKLRKHYLIVSPEANEDIVTTPQFAVLALKAVELEMERRYDKLAKAAVRSLNDYNHKVAQGKLVSTQDEQHYHLPYIVVIIDELADLMITAAREIEEPICRIAQMARAVGIHLILATQRPSVDVITGVIKANFPARIAYQVASRVDSRTILDSMGAEQLLGNGDMLYQPSGTPKPIRLQSPFISTDEVEAMIEAVASQDGPHMSYSRPWTLPSLKQKQGAGASADDGMRDELFDEAARIIVRHQQGSVSLLQRRLKVGYSRAARIVDELEQAGIVGPFDGSKARQVLCETEEELELVLEGLR